MNSNYFNGTFSENNRALAQRLEAIEMEFNATKQQLMQEQSKNMHLAAIIRKFNNKNQTVFQQLTDQLLSMVDTVSQLTQIRTSESGNTSGMTSTTERLDESPKNMLVNKTHPISSNENSNDNLNKLTPDKQNNENEAREIFESALQTVNTLSTVMDEDEMDADHEEENCIEKTLTPHHRTNNSTFTFASRRMSLNSPSSSATSAATTTNNLSRGFIGNDYPFSSRFLSSPTTTAAAATATTMNLTFKVDAKSWNRKEKSKRLNNCDIVRMFEGDSLTLHSVSQLQMSLNEVIEEEEFQVNLEDSVVMNQSADHQFVQEYKNDENFARIDYEDNPHENDNVYFTTNRGESNLNDENDSLLSPAATSSSTFKVDCNSQRKRSEQFQNITKRSNNSEITKTLDCVNNTTSAGTELQNSLEEKTRVVEFEKENEFIMPLIKREKMSMGSEAFDDSCSTVAMRLSIDDNSFAESEMTIEMKNVEMDQVDECRIKCDEKQFNRKTKGKEVELNNRNEDETVPDRRRGQKRQILAQVEPLKVNIRKHPRSTRR